MIKAAPRLFELAKTRAARQVRLVAQFIAGNNDLAVVVIDLFGGVSENGI